MARRRTDARIRSAIRHGLTALALVALVACGAPTSPDPDPELAISGIEPDLALPGQEVTVTGTGFAEGQIVAFDGTEATVVSQTATSVVVIVPDAYGYPVVSVDDVSVERLLFVGSAYAGPATLTDVQDALDGLSEGAALRIGAGTYTGTDLVVDNRQLYGAGAGTVLEASGDVTVLARSSNLAVLAELAVEAVTVELARGRLSTAAVESSPSAGAILLADVDADVDALIMMAGTHLDVSLQNVSATAAALVLSGPGASVAIDGGDVTAGVVQLGALTDLRIDGAALTTVVGSLILETTGSIEVRDSTLTSADAIVFDGVGDMTVEDAQLTALASIVFDASGGAVALGRTGAVAADLVVVAQRGISVDEVVADTTAGSVVLQSVVGDIVVSDSTVTPETSFVLTSPQGSLDLRDTDVTTAANSIELQALGRITIADASLQSALDLVAESVEAGEVVVVRSLLTSVSNMVIQGAFSPFAGANGTVHLEDNSALTAGAGFVVVGRTSDVVLVDNGPIEGDSIVVQSAAAHVTLRNNERFESATIVVVQAAGAGGRLTVVDNLFIADDGAGTIILETLAGALTESGNVFTGTTSFPSNE